MLYEEKIINDKLMCRTERIIFNNGWVPCSRSRLHAKISEQQNEINFLKKELELFNCFFEKNLRLSEMLQSRRFI